ncbi:MAG: FtsX-like permease family protein [Spirochaetaceae bacterium]|nr:MAG: FtsX-like permease family protein [Spirochaetaceae bacterium]
MTIASTIKISIKNILKNKMRSFLTALGIIIGVGSVIVMVGIGTGTSVRIENEMRSMGTNLIMIFAGGQRSGGGVSQGAASSNRLSLADMQKISKEGSWIQAVSPQVNTQAQIIYASYNWRTQVSGVSEEYQIVRNYTMQSGSFFTEADVKGSRTVAVLGQTVADELFPYTDPLNKQIRVNNVPFKVAGVLASKGSSGFGQDQDDLILVPYTTAMNKLTGSQSLRSILVSTTTEDMIEAQQTEITSILRSQHRLKESDADDFTIGTQTEITERASSIGDTMALLLGSIAAVSLLVGGIGIMNIMLVSVKERTKEIGLRMAVGAKGRNIMLQFLIEAFVLSMLGGLLGTIVSFMLAAVLNGFNIITVVIEWGIVALAFVFSGSVGIFFGLYPAKKASELDPIEALRYE